MSRDNPPPSDEQREGEGMTQRQLIYSVLAALIALAIWDVIGSRIVGRVVPA